jgi:prevent-host-death family protein
MKTVNIQAAKANFSALVEEASKGKEIIIAKAGKPMARLMPLQKQKKKKKDIASTLGMLKGKNLDQRRFR